MTWEVLIGLIGAVCALIGAIWAIVKYYDEKKTKQENQRQEKIDKICTLVEKVERDNTSQQEALRHMRDDLIVIQEDVTNIHEQLHLQQHNIHDNEIHRLQTAIVDFADKLRAGQSVSLMNFQYIFSQYEKYHSMGGNTFIDSEMEFIKSRKREWDLENSREQ